MIYPPGEKLSYLLIFDTIKNFFGVYNLEHPSQILKVTFHFDICSFVQISRKLGGFCKLQRCAIFWEISHLHLKNFRIVCIVLFSAHIKCIIYFSLSVPAVLKWTHPKNEQYRSSTLGPRHLNPMDILRNVFTSRTFSRFLLTAVWILFFNSLIYCQK